MRKVTKKMSRVKRKQRENTQKKIINLIKKIINNIRYFVIAIIYMVLTTYIAIEKGFIKIWKMFPKWAKRIIILTMLVNIICLNDAEPQITEKIKTITEIDTVYAVKEIMIEPQKCEYGLYECAIYTAALDYGLNEEQGKIAIAISKHETGNFTSSLFKNGNNVGGLYKGGGKFYKFNTIEDGIDTYIRTLKNGYFNKGLNTIEEIQKKYCPIGAENDPTGLNKNWVSGVTYFYNELN